MNYRTHTFLDERGKRTQMLLVRRPSHSPCCLCDLGSPVNETAMYEITAYNWSLLTLRVTRTEQEVYNLPLGLEYPDNPADLEVQLDLVVLSHPGEKHTRR